MSWSSLPAGRNLLGAHRAGAYLFPVGAGSQASGSALGVNTVVASPVWVSADTAIDRIALYINSGVATAVWRLCVYADAGLPYPYPGALLLDAGTIDASTSGLKELTPTTTPIRRELWWVGGKVETAFGTPRGTSGPVPGVVPGTASNTTDIGSGYACQHAPAGLPTTWPAWGVAGTGVVVTAPRVGIRITG